MTDTITTFRGKKIEVLSRDELLEALRLAIRIIEIERDARDFNEELRRLKP